LHRVKREADSSPPSGVEDKNGGAIRVCDTPSLCFVVTAENLTYSFVPINLSTSILHLPFHIHFHHFSGVEIPWWVCVEFCVHALYSIHKYFPADLYLF
jgi:hypothetical protein